MLSLVDLAVRAWLLRSQWPIAPVLRFAQVATASGLATASTLVPLVPLLGLGAGDVRVPARRFSLCEFLLVSARGLHTCIAGPAENVLALHTPRQARELPSNVHRQTWIPGTGAGWRSYGHDIGGHQVPCARDLSRAALRSCRCEL